MNKLLAFTITVVSVCLPSPAQQISESYFQTPNASDLGRYGDTKVSYYTGLPNIEIPLYRFDIGGLDFPISLTYDASGVPVNKFPGWTGSNWTLQAGGAIVRTMQGHWDEAELANKTTLTSFSNYFSSPSQLLADMHDDNVLKENLYLNRCDYSPDVFTYPSLDVNNAYTGAVYDGHAFFYLQTDDDDVKEYQYVQPGASRSANPLCSTRAKVLRGIRSPNLDVDFEYCDENRHFLRKVVFEKDKDTEETYEMKYYFPENLPADLLCANVDDWGYYRSIVPTASGSNPFSIDRSGTLSRETTTDEDDRTTSVYKDFMGNKVLERRDKANDTYYVYNDIGQLRYVLSPEYQKSGYKDMYAYKYRYDTKGRVVKKILPGCEYTQYWYDDAGRVAFMQDATLRGKELYRFFIYDLFGRTAMQGTFLLPQYIHMLKVPLINKSQDMIMNFLA